MAPPAQFLGPAYGEVSPDGIDYFKWWRPSSASWPSPNQTASFRVGQSADRTLVVVSDDEIVTLSDTAEMYEGGGAFGMRAVDLLAEP